MSNLRDDFVDRLLCGCHNVQDALRAIEHEGPYLSAARVAIGLHVVALSAAPLGPDERSQLANTPLMSNLMQQLGAQLNGTGEADLHGMASILWALALLEQTENPELQKLISRLLLFITHSHGSTAWLVAIVQSLAQLKMLGGAVGAALAAKVHARLDEFNAAQLGSLARLLAEALGSGAEPLLRQVLATRADSFLRADRGPPGVSPTIQLTGMLHAGASLLVALSAAVMMPAPPAEFIEALCDALQHGIDPARLALPRLSELLRALHRLSVAEHSLALALDQELRYRVARIDASQLEAAMEELQTHGPGLAPALMLVRERQALMQQQLRGALGTAPDEKSVLRLLREADRLMSAPQLIVALARLAELVEACPDPEARAAALTSSADFSFVLKKVEACLGGGLDAAQQRDALCALASLRVRQPVLLMAFGEQISAQLHVLTSTDAARCLWAFCTLKLLQAPAYPKMMRALEKHLPSLPAKLLCQLVRAIVPLGRSAACARLLPKLCDALVHAAPRPSFSELLATAREVCRRTALPQPLLTELCDVVASECSGEGEGTSLSGNLTPRQVVTALWLFVRHLPLIQAQAPYSQLASQLTPLITQLLLLISDLASLPSESLCDVIHVQARLRRGGPLLHRMLSQIEARLERSQLRAPQMMEASWALYELHPGCEHPVAGRLVDEVGRLIQCSTEGVTNVLVEALGVVSALPMRRPLPLVEPLAKQIIMVPTVEPDQLVKLYDALARLRYNGPMVLEALEHHASELLKLNALHEAQVGCIVEALGLLNYQRAVEGGLMHMLLARLHAAPLLLPHTAAAAIHGLALLRLVPDPAAAPYGCSQLMQLMEASTLSLDLSELATIMTSLIELRHDTLARELVQKQAAGVRQQLQAEQALPKVQQHERMCDLHAQIGAAWSMLHLELYADALLPPLLMKLCKVGAGARQPLQVRMLAEVAVMLRDEAPQALAQNAQWVLPQQLVFQATSAFQQQQQLAAEPSQLLRDLAQALNVLGLQHAVRVCPMIPLKQVQSAFLIDVALAPEATGGALVALLVHPPTHYVTTTCELLGRVHLKRRLLQKQGWAIVDISVLEWKEMSSVGGAVALLRKLLQPHLQR